MSAPDYDGEPYVTGDLHTRVASAYVWLPCLTCPQIIRHEITVTVRQSGSGAQIDRAILNDHHSCPNL